jgi:hypothetical protein
MTGKAMTKMKDAVNRLNRRITRGNAAFEKMSKAEKRVQLAKDVISQIEVGRLKPTSGTWLDIKAPKSVKAQTELQEVLKDIKKCEGCAVGALLLCAIDRKDDLKISQLNTYYRDATFKKGDAILIDGEEDALKYLERFFSTKQVMMIEAAFEQGSSFNNGPDDVYFVPEVENARDRMTLIMQNIIENNGTFKPPKLTKQDWDRLRAKGYDPDSDCNCADCRAYRTDVD